MSVLDRILAAKLGEVERLRLRGAELQRLAAMQTPAKPFAAALRAGNNVALIAEFKRRSPSANWICRDGSVAEITKAYSDGGARAISVLTDRDYFAGSIEDLRIARAKTCVPLLRKDFVLDELQLLEARAACADAVLLIARALDQTRLRALFSFARDVGLEVLVETHDENEIARAIDVGADVIGINARDLATFDVDHTRVQRLAAGVPSSVVLIAESGVHTAEDVARVAEAGFDAVLVGEALMRAPDITAYVGSLCAQPKMART